MLVRNKVEHKTCPDRMLLPERISPIAMRPVGRGDALLLCSLPTSTVRISLPHVWSLPKHAGKQPKDYRYCGYAEALAKGSSLARDGIRIVLGHSEDISWKEVSQQYRKYLFVHGSLHTNTKQPAYTVFSVALSFSAGRLSRFVSPKTFVLQNPP